MKYLNEYKENEKICGVYLVKEKKVFQTKNGSDYYSITLADKSGTLESRIWDITSPNIFEFNKLDYVGVKGHVQGYNDSLQGNINWIKVAPADTYDISDYQPTSPHDIEEMIKELKAFIESVDDDDYRQILNSIFEEYFDDFMKNSAASSVHHAFVGGLLQHSLEVTRTCNFLANNYAVLNRNLLITAAILHDIGKIYELTPFPENSYSDEGNLIGHIVMGVEIIDKAIGKLDAFPKNKAIELKHCILAHHGELEWGSPKKPMLVEAQILHFADNISAKIEAYTELFQTKSEDGSDWYMSKALGGRVKRTSMN